jgi:hypothetical protein
MKKAGDVFKSIDSDILDYVQRANERVKYLTI